MAKHPSPGNGVHVWTPAGPTTPRKDDPLPSEQPESGRHPGQILVMFALFSVALIGLLGLATDVGYAMAGRRAAQAAADAGAIGGARVIARYSSSAPTAAQSDVNSIVQTNVFGPWTPSLYQCEYIGDNWAVVGTCNQTVPSNATGSRVQTRLTFNTFFIRVLPGAPKTVTAAGYAKARVRLLANLPADGPFIVCGYNTWNVTSDPTTANGGSSLSIVSSASPFQLNQAAIGKTFRIWDNKLGNKNANCGLDANSFKGLADGTANSGKTAPNWFTFKTGSTAGSLEVDVVGAEGCKAGAQPPYNCVMFLPVATNNPLGDNSAKTIRVIGFAAFKVTVFDSQSANGILLDDYITMGPGKDGWCRDCGGPVVINLIW